MYNLLGACRPWKMSEEYTQPGPSWLRSTALYMLLPSVTLVYALLSYLMTPLSDDFAGIATPTQYRLSMVWSHQ